MPILPYRHLKPTPEAEATFRRWLSQLNEEFTRHQSVDRRSEIVRDELIQLYLARPHGGRQQASLPSELATHGPLGPLAPRNATPEPDHHRDPGPERHDN